MKCPHCNAWTTTLETRGHRRRRECGNGHRFTTYEVLAEPAPFEFAAGRVHPLTLRWWDDRQQCKECDHCTIKVGAKGEAVWTCGATAKYCIDAREGACRDGVLFRPIGERPPRPAQVLKARWA